MNVTEYWGAQPPKQRLRWRIYMRMDRVEDSLYYVGINLLWPNWLQRSICWATSHVPQEHPKGTFCSYCERDL